LVVVVVVVVVFIPSEYARAMQSDFSTSTPTHRVASQINLMASMQEFFTYEMAMYGCGIKAVELLGTQQDWDQLVIKLRQVKKELEPILNRLGDVDSSWWDHVEYVFQKLAETYSSQQQQHQQTQSTMTTTTTNTASKEICDFWADIFMISNAWKYGPSGQRMRCEVKQYNGWFVKFLLGRDKVLEEDFFDKENEELMKGLNSVPMTVSMTYQQPPMSADSTLIAGLMGYTVEPPKKTFNGVPSVQPHHMWAMKLPTDSPARRPCDRKT
jgi:Domain of unknown function (DUF4419)